MGNGPEWMGNAPEFEKRQWTKQNITVEPGDSQKCYIYTIDQAKLPASAGLICKKIPFMNDENGSSTAYSLISKMRKSVSNQAKQAVEKLISAAVRFVPDSFGFPCVHGFDRMRWTFSRPC